MKYKIKLLSFVLLFSLSNITFGYDKKVTVSVQAPFLFQIEYPPMAIHENSLLYAYAIAESEIQLAKKDNRKPVFLKIPMEIKSLSALVKSKGYDVKFSTGVKRRKKVLVKMTS